jgi:hypothetical protein
MEQKTKPKIEIRNGKIGKTYYCSESQRATFVEIPDTPEMRECFDFSVVDADGKQVVCGVEHSIGIERIGSNA